jgi:hypothetical protein
MELSPRVNQIIQLAMFVGVAACSQSLIPEPWSSWVLIFCSGVQVVFGITAYNVVPKKKE